MTLRDALQEGIRLLGEMDTPFLDASVLLAHTLGISKEKLLASYPDPLSPEDEERYRACLNQRLAGLPVAYILWEKEFFGRPFKVDPRVLTPRPDTEILVEAALAAAEILRAEGVPLLRVADVCTGTGCIALTMVLEDSGLTMTASDLSGGAAEVFALNRAALCPDDGEASERIRFRRGDLLGEDPGPYDMILSNPPYLSSDEVAEMRSRAWPEPEMALEGGPDGLDLVRVLVAQSRDRLVKKGILLWRRHRHRCPP